MTAPLLGVEALEAGYEEALVLRGVSLRVAERPRSWPILGPNGAGKSTLLRAVYGLPAAGREGSAFDGRGAGLPTS